MNAVPHDRPEQLEKVTAGLLSGETITAVYDGIGKGTGFCAITDRRVVIQDNSFTGGKTAVTSLPYSRISSVSYVADKSRFGKLYSSSEVAITVGSTVHEVAFRGEDKARHIHDHILWMISQR
jgi:hypothetical protein